MMRLTIEVISDVVEDETLCLFTSRALLGAAESVAPDGMSLSHGDIIAKLILLTTLGVNGW